MRKSVIKALMLTLAAGLFAGAAHAGQKNDEPMNPPPAHWKIPPAPILTPEEALKTLKVPAGLKVEIVAAHPLIHDPVAIAYDADGRMYVVEMRGYMHDVAGAGEDQRIGTIALLEDTDGDGRMDKRTEFAGGLLMPRSVVAVEGGVLVGEPPNLWFMRDTNGDGVADEKVLVYKDYGAQGNPEHTSNSITRNLDNWHYASNWNNRIRKVEGKWVREPSITRGQWGLTQDSTGRMYHNTNSDQLRGDLVPGYYFRNPNYVMANRNAIPLPGFKLGEAVVLDKPDGPAAEAPKEAPKKEEPPVSGFKGVTQDAPTPAGLKVKVGVDQTTWPARMNPGVNRGYKKSTLREDGTLRTFTAACAPWVYRGDALPEEYHNNIFVCEPSGNLIKRNVIKPAGTYSILGTNVHDKTEFLTSTDERFRPVNLCDAPDGSLIIVDLYRGILQHRVFLTPFLKKQVIERGLDKGLGLGHIYRVVPENYKYKAPEKLAAKKPTDWAAALTSPNGWVRDTAQRLLVEYNGTSIVKTLEKMVSSDANPLARLHALWTIEGLDSLDAPVILTALNDADPRVRAAAMRLSEKPVFAELSRGKLTETAGLVDKLAALGDEKDPQARWQLTLTLSAINHPKTLETLTKILASEPDSPFIRDAAISGLRGRELEMLTSLLTAPGWNDDNAGRSNVIQSLAACVSAERDPARVLSLWDKAAALKGDWQKLAIVSGMAAGKPKLGKRIREIELAATNPSVAALTKSANAKIKSAADSALKLLTQKPPPRPKPPELTADQKSMFERGKDTYSKLCAACHQSDGGGEEGKAPPLIDADWVMGPESRLARIVLHGAKGPFEIKLHGEKNAIKYNATGNLEMPAHEKVLTDDQIAEVLTYIRHEWDHWGTPVDAATIKKIREETKGREEAWTDKALREIK